MTQESLLGAGGIGIVVGVVQLAKNLGLESKFAPAVALALGLALVLAYSFSYPADKPIFDAIVQGLILGLGASGLYTTTQTVSKGATVLRENEVKDKDVVVVPQGMGEFVVQGIGEALRESPSEQPAGTPVVEEVPRD